MTEPATGSTPKTGQDLADIMARFESAWRSGLPPPIEDFLPAARRAASAMDQGQRELLEQLVKIDLEFRWRQGVPAGYTSALPERPRLEHYVARFAALAPPDRLPEDLIGQEYLVRHLFGDRPAHQEYADRFPRHGAKLQQAICRIDTELKSEFSHLGKPVLPPHPPLQDRHVPLAEPCQPMVSIGELLDFLRQTPLLKLDQLNELMREHLQGRVVDAHTAGEHLLKRGWLTPYQLEQILGGRGKNLLSGSYLLLDPIGEGATGRVFKARHVQMQRLVALKIIRPEVVTDPEVVTRFYREVQVISQLGHPNVVHAYDAGPVGATHFLAMEYVDGIDLNRLVKQSGPLPVGTACDYIRQAAIGLQHAHQRGLVHRDIKPSNLLLVQAEASHSFGLVKILDLGLARLQRNWAGEATLSLSFTNATGSITPVGSVMMGTPDYLAPEQAVDFHAADIRADIYSLGCTFWYLLTGQPPFPGGTLALKLLSHQQREPSGLEQLRPDLPPSVTSVLKQMLAKRPEDRLQTPAAVAAALAAGSPAAAADSGNRTGAPARSLRRPRERRRLLVTAWIAGLVLALALGAVYWRSDSPPRARRSALSIPPPARPAAARSCRACRRKLFWAGRSITSASSQMTQRSPPVGDGVASPSLPCRPTTLGRASIGMAPSFTLATPTSTTPSPRLARRSTCPPGLTRP